MKFIIYNQPPGRTRGRRSAKKGNIRKDFSKIVWFNR